MAISALYELVEWWAALALGQGPDEVLGTQGDAWDTQSDVILARIGAGAAWLLFIRQIGQIGTGPGQFARPKGVAVDREGRMYVVDAAFENVQMFDRAGQLLMHFGGAYQGPGFMSLPAKVVVDYDDLELFQRYVDPRFVLDHLILVTNQYGPDKVSVYGFVPPKEAPHGAP